MYVCAYAHQTHILPIMTHTFAPGSDETCFGVPGIKMSGGAACCALSCGECVQDGCNQMNGGGNFSNLHACCYWGIYDTGRFCSITEEAPCLVDDRTCDGDIPGIQEGQFCCPLMCGSCDADDCEDQRSVAGFSSSDACCGTGVLSLGRDCSEVGEAPCSISNGKSIDSHAGNPPTCEIISTPVSSVNSIAAPVFYSLGFVASLCPLGV